MKITCQYIPVTVEPLTDTAKESAKAIDEIDESDDVVTLDVLETTTWPLRISHNELVVFQEVLQACCSIFRLRRSLFRAIKGKGNNTPVKSFKQWKQLKIQQTIHCSQWSKIFISTYCMSPLLKSPSSRLRGGLKFH
uniref:Uncharacterized protein n=1 Tax=Glossina palpalis gambiensis TaxID=67801 RepID=A0A1B0BGB3_9MUSC